MLLLKLPSGEVLSIQDGFQDGDNHFSSASYKIVPLISSYIHS